MTGRDPGLAAPNPPIPSVPELGRGRRAELMGWTAWAMTVATIQTFATAVLAAELLAELGITRWQVGVIGAVNTGVGAVTAPRLGRLADRLGAGRAMVGLIVVSGAGLILTAVSWSFWLLVVASALAGLPQGASNPVTNKVIAHEVPPRQQGVVTGVKQSGVQFAVFLSGATLPSAAHTVGWRAAVAGLGVFTIVTGLAAAGRFGDEPARPAGPGPLPPGAASSRAPVAPGAASSRAPGTSGATSTQPPVVSPQARRFVRQVAIYALLLGLAAGGMTRFYPLFAHEVLGYSESTAGLAVSLAGLTAIVARLVWARAVETVMTTRTALVVLGLGGALTASVLYAAEAPGLRWLLWPAMVAVAFTVVAWNVVAMLAVIRSVPPEASGQSTGVVLLGFLGGLTIAAPLVGWSVDLVGSYRPAWVGLGLVSLLGSLVLMPRRGRP